MKRSHMVRVAKQEMESWKLSIPPSLVLAILFAFIHRLTTGDTVEETFFQKYDDPEDYQI